MMKLNGKEYPVSILKMYLHDELLDKLQWMTSHLKLENNVATMNIVINHLYTVLKDQDDYYKTGETKPLEPKILLNTQVPDSNE